MRDWQVIEGSFGPAAADGGEDDSVTSSGGRIDDLARRERTVLLLGNLNVGKTTLFSRLCGEMAQVSNFPGTTVSVGRGTLTEAGARFRLIDTPGIESLLPVSEDERISRAILLDEKPDIVLLVADGRNLRRSLLLMFEIAEYRIPFVLDINLMDESRQRGIEIDADTLSSLLAVPVVQTIAVEGVGVDSLRRALLDARLPDAAVTYPARLESAISLSTKVLKGADLSPRAASTALLVGNEELKRYVASNYGADAVEQINGIAQTVQSSMNRPLSALVLESRLLAVDRVIFQVQSICPPATMPFSQKIGEWTRRPLTGFPIAALVAALMYLFVGRLGAGTLVGFVEHRLFGDVIVPFTGWILRTLSLDILRDALIGKFGLVSVGLSLAFGVVLPVLVMFFFLFGALEDSGYLPRLSVLLDRVLRRVGLNGRGLIPLAMGFSCNTIAILSTRVLETKRERFIATLLLAMGIPCAPVMSVMLVLLSGMSLWATVAVFGLITTQIFVVGFLVNNILPGTRSDFILELPPLRIPRIRTLVGKTLMRVGWFLREALVPFLAATFTLFLLDTIGLLAVLEKAAKPVLTHLLGLPGQSVEVVIMTVIRKESGAALLKQLSDTGVFDHVQTVVSLLLLTFLSPCINSILVMLKERGLKATLAIMGLVGSYALVLGALMNLICRTLRITF